MTDKERTDKRAETHACVCISRQDAVELAMKYCPDDDGAVQCDGDIRELLDELENLPPIQPEWKWIPCSERLPEKNCRCLTSNEAWGSFEVDWNAWIDGQWLRPNEKPIAWMPFPEPYQSEAERRTDGQE